MKTGCLHSVLTTWGSCLFNAKVQNSQGKTLNMNSSSRDQKCLP